MAIGYIDTDPRKEQTLSFSLSFNENVGAMLFDISGFSNPFSGFDVLRESFGNNRLCCINNMKDATELGIEDNDFLNGLLYYHVSQFYRFVNTDYPLYICLSDCSDNWEVIEKMQRDANGRLFHIGIWTSQPVWEKDGDNIIFSPLIFNINNSLKELNGDLGTLSSSAVPLSVLLFPNTNYIEGINSANISYKKLPDAIPLHCPKISIIMAQNGSETAHKIQDANPHKAPVSIVGLVMGCLALCGAEESIASVQTCNLNKNEDFNNPEWGFGKDYNIISQINRYNANLISDLGYIIPISYDDLDGSYFLSSDQTISSGYLGVLSNNRIIHKCRRCVCRSLLPYINSSFIFDSSSKSLETSAISQITDSIYTLMDSVMINTKGQSQINNRSVSFSYDINSLNNDTLAVSLEIEPVNYNNIIIEEVWHEDLT